VERIMGLLFDQAHGLLTYAPLYLTLLPGSILLWRTSRRRCAELLMLIAGYIIPVAIPALNAHGWQGGWAPAARFLVPISPLLAPAFFGVKMIVHVPLSPDSASASYGTFTVTGLPASGSRQGTSNCTRKSSSSADPGGIATRCCAVPSSSETPVSRWREDPGPEAAVAVAAAPACRSG
jgi:hypothetical protein